MLAIGVLLLAASGQAATPPGMVDAFSAGEGGYACFRLPALLRLPGRSSPPQLALFAEGRNKSCSDYAPTDVVYKRSLDGGRSWGALSVIAGTDHDRDYGNTSNQPTPVIAASPAGPRVVLLFNRGGRVLMARSSDPAASAWEYKTRETGIGGSRHGVTVGPTAGVALASGRLAVAAHFGSSGAALLSDDGGHSWRLSNTTTVRLPPALLLSSP